MPQHDLATPDAYFVQEGEDRYVPTRHVQGAWRATEQHVAPLAGLLAHAIETNDPRPGLRLARLHYEILGVIALAPTQVRVSTIRRGRTIEPGRGHRIDRGARGRQRPRLAPGRRRHQRRRRDRPAQPS